ncbi:MAG: peptide-methionine (S)-S-oxide reductase MsrA [Methylocella sp.]
MTTFARAARLRQIAKVSDPTASKNSFNFLFYCIFFTRTGIHFARKCCQGAIVALALGFGGPVAAESAKLVPAPAQDPAETGTQTLVVSGGCFWGVQGVFQHVKGVESAVSGYAGGAADAAQYETVSSGRTGHAESVEITYDPHVVSAGQLLRIFFSVAHDPTQRDRQGPDTGTQYRSAIFTTSKSQMALAKSYIEQLDHSGAFSRPIATEVRPLKGFYPAEAHHQDFLALHPDQPYIVYNDLPKVENLKRLFPNLYSDKPRLVGDAKNPS